MINEFYQIYGLQTCLLHCSWWEHSHWGAWLVLTLTATSYNSAPMAFSVPDVALASSTTSTRVSRSFRFFTVSLNMRATSNLEQQSLSMAATRREEAHLALTSFRPMFRNSSRARASFCSRWPPSMTSASSWSGEHSRDRLQWLNGLRPSISAADDSSYRQRYER